MANTEDYCSLKWSNFRSSLTKGFHDFLQEEAMVDVTLAVEGKVLQAHKLVLSVCSPYFKNLFKINPCKHPIVILKDVGHKDISYMLEFMYKGEVGIKNEDLPSFLKLADTLKVKGLAGENIQMNENSLSQSLKNNVVRVKKKFKKKSVSEASKENNELLLDSEKVERKVLKSKKRRLPSKSDPVKKLKIEKSASINVNKGEIKNSDNVSEDEDNNPLIKFMESDNVKNSEGSKQSESQCDNESESHGDSKLSFSVWSDGTLESDDSGGPDINSFLQPVQSDETEQTPQGGVDYQMIQTKRGRDMLLFAGYTFTQNRMCRDGMRWQCSYPKCKAFCRMSSAGWLTPHNTRHDHPKPSEREIKKRILRMELKARAQSSGATPGEILRNALPTDEFHSNDRACFTRCIQRFRKSLQRKNSKLQDKNWSSSEKMTQPDQEPLKSQPSTNGEPSWLSHPRPLLPVCDPAKTDEWHPHQDPVLVDKQTQLLDEKGILQGKMESYGI